MKLRHIRLCVLLGTLLPGLAAGQVMPLGSEFQVDPGTSFVGVVAADPSGNFIVAWTEGSVMFPTNNHVAARRYDSNGAAQGSEFQVNTFTPNDLLVSDVAAGGNGRFTIVMQSDAGVFARRYDSGGSPLGTEFQVNTYTTGDQGFGGVAAAASGDFVIVWASDFQDASGRGMFGQRFASSGASLGTEFQINTYTTLDQYPFWRSPVAAAADGDFVVVWQSDGQDGSDNGIFGQRFDSAGNALDMEFQVNTYTTGAQERAAVSADPAGNFVVVWVSMGQDGSDLGVFARRFDDTGASLGSEFQVNTFTTGQQGFASVAAGADGSFTMVWRSHTQDQNIFGQRYDASGLAVGTEFQVNTYTTDSQDFPMIAAGAGSDFIVTWTRGDVDTQTFHIVGQRFTVAPPSLLDHYKCYQGKDLKNPKFNTISVTTADQIVPSEMVEVQKVKFVCTPVNKNGEGINDPSAHLTCYQTKGAILEPRPHVEVSTQFQTSQFELKKPKLLCLPSTKTVIP